MDNGQTLFGQKVGHDGGWIQELEQLVDVAAQQLIGHIKVTSEAAGMPWGSEKISEAQALERIKEYEDAGKVADLEKWSDQVVMAAAIDAMRRRKKAQKLGVDDSLPAKLDGEQGRFTPAAIQPGALPAAISVAPAIQPAAQVQTSLPAQMALPGLTPM